MDLVHLFWTKLSSVIAIFIYYLLSILIRRELKSRHRTCKALPWYSKFCQFSVIYGFISSIISSFSFFPLFFSHFSAMFAPLLDWQNRIGACVPTWEEKIWQLGRKETKIAYFPIRYCKDKCIWICPNSFIYLHINHDSESEPGIFTKKFKVRFMLSP